MSDIIIIISDERHTCTLCNVISSIFRVVSYLFYLFRILVRFDYLLDNTGSYQTNNDNKGRLPNRQ